METFFISDTHFSHTKMLSFLRENGEPLRPWENQEELDEYMISQWNSVVAKEDKVYHLGDVYLGKGKASDVLSRLNGIKVLIKGNHDERTSGQEWLEYFKDIRSCHKLGKLYLTHIPIHKYCLENSICNVHGHIHDRILWDDRITSERFPDPKYCNISCEQIGYTPISYDDLKVKIVLQYERIGEALAKLGWNIPTPSLEEL